METRVADKIFKNWSVFVDNVKQGLAQKAKLSLPTGNESVVTDDGHQGVTQGKVNAKLTLTAYATHASEPSLDAVYRAWKSKKKVTITCGVVLGRVLKIPMNVMNLELDTDMVKGSSMVDIELEGGMPDDIG